MESTDKPENNSPAGFMKHISVLATSTCCAGSIQVGPHNMCINLVDLSVTATTEHPLCQGNPQLKLALGCMR
jgi:hypothetical protein